MCTLCTIYILKLFKSVLITDIVMNSKKMDTETAKEVEKILHETGKPQNEPIIVPIIVNKSKSKVTNQEYKQFKINIPLKFANIINLDEKKCKVKFTLLKEGKYGRERKLIAEIIGGSNAN